MSAQKKEELIKFVEEKCESKKILILIDVAREFKEKSGCHANVDTLRKAIRRYSMEEVPKILHHGKRAKQLFALSVKINKDLMNKIQTHAYVKLDSDQKIVEYVSDDGSLTLKGNQSRSGKMKIVHRKGRMAAAKDGDEDVSDNENPPAPKKSRVSTPGSSIRAKQSPTQLLKAKNAELQKSIEELQKEVEQSNSKMEKRIGQLQGEIRKQEVQLSAFSSTLEKYRTGAAQNQKEKQELEKEKMEMRKKNDQLDAFHQAEVERLKGATQDLQEKMQTQDETHSRKILEMEALHKEEMDQMKRKTADAARLQQEMDKEQKEKNAMLQKKLDELMSNQEAASRVLSEVAQMLNADGNAQSTSNKSYEIMEQLKNQITEEMEEEKMDAVPKEASPVEEHKNETDVETETA